jgi:hypothetical protein
MSAPPADYDAPTATLDVDYEWLWQLAGDIENAYVPSIVDSLKKINDMWSGLKIGWAGKTAEEAKDLADKWSHVMVQLFGPFDAHTPIAKDEAILPRIVKIAKAASENYGKSEDIVAGMFEKALNAMGVPGYGRVDNTVPSADSSRDFHDGPVIEKNDGWRDVYTDPSVGDPVDQTPRDSSDDSQTDNHLSGDHKAN